jgi:subtilase family serine protease
MRKTRTLVAGIGTAAVVAGMTIVGASGVAGAASRPAAIALQGSIAPFTGASRAIGDLPASTRLSVQLWLRPRTAAAERFATAVSTPGSGLFHRYLSPAAYTARFAASPAQPRAVATWLRAQGFTGVHADPGRSYVAGSGTTGQAEVAFRTQIREYRSSRAVNAGQYVLHANSAPVHIPSSLAGSVIGITGLDNATPTLPLVKQVRRTTTARVMPCSHYYAQHEIGGLPRQFGVTRFPTYGCGYTAAQLRSAYGSSKVNTGQGQTVALVEEGLTKDMFLTLKDYAAADGMPAPSRKRYAQLALGNVNACGDPFDTEEQLDVEAAYDMAPAAHELVVAASGCASDIGAQGLFDAEVKILGGSSRHPLASIVSNSWGSGSELEPPSYTSIANAYLVRAAGEGVGMYYASGDVSGNVMPATDPFTISVGATTLGINKAGTRIFQTGWSDSGAQLASKSWIALGELGASGGGPSVLWQQPAYQKGVVPAALAKAPGNRSQPVRSVPDVSAVGDITTGFSVGVLTFPKGKSPRLVLAPVGGTSVASPLIAGMVAAAQQGQPRTFGFLDPVLYKLPRSAYSDPLPITSHSPAAWHGVLCPAFYCGSEQLSTSDDQSNSMPGYTGQVTLPGYDNMTGLGTPNGQVFITALRQLAG